ncbi:interleukin-1 receptor-associated kinase 1-binding protein 1 homolog [Eucyclogobius newberryi]|uniref:interleukin-1 receptor-associated kinase 1-binding protein 1 homolog n=1 Tax=Eucyclogobius newberryi TaxID=166745 RepID=UPI003B5BD137
MEPQPRVFATALVASPARDMEQILDTERRTPRLAPRSRELQVTGSAELCVPADRASVRVRVSSSKETVNEASDSVSRRLDYILQCFRQHGVKDEDTVMCKFLRREENLYHVDLEATATFSDFSKMERVCGALLEKLDKSVTVGLSYYHHSPECLERLRRLVCTSAVDNAKKKAGDIGQLLGQTLGSPLLVVEEELREVRSDFYNGSEPRSLTSLLSIPSITAFSRVSVTFGLNDRIGK